MVIGKVFEEWVWSIVIYLKLEFVVYFGKLSENMTV